MKYKFSADLNRHLTMCSSHVCNRTIKPLQALQFANYILMLYSFQSIVGIVFLTHSMSSQSCLTCWSVALFKINHFNSEYYLEDLFLFWSFLTVPQIIYFIYNCLLVCPCNVFKFLVKTSASADPTVVVQDRGIHTHIKCTMPRRPCLEELKLVVPQSTQLVIVTSGRS